MAVSIVSAEEVKEIEEKFQNLSFRSVNNPEKGKFHALIISYCNGGPEKPWSFCDAIVGYSTRTPVPLCLWNRCLIEGILNMVSKKDVQPDFFKGTKDLMVESVWRMKNQHEKCLKQLLEEEKLSKEKIKCILAIHYFQPLSKQGAECYVDKCQGFKKCLTCGKDVKADHKKTSFGNSLVWHGQADILVESTSVVNSVKVSLEQIEEATDKLNVPDQLETEDEDQEIDDLNGCSKIVEVKTEDSHSQAIAQTIVNAFVESIRDNFLFDKYIPSFFATNKNIRIILYNCKSDKLLFSEELPIWKGNVLNISTMIFVWMELNYIRNLKDHSEKILENIIPECRFKEAVGDGYEIYLKRVSRPFNKEMKLDSHKEEFLEFITENHSVEMDEVRELYLGFQRRVNATMSAEKK